MTSEISIRTSRARRGADIADELNESPPSHHIAETGEAAWHLGEPLTEPRSAKEKEGENNESAPPLPVFPEFGDTEEEESGPGLDLERYVRGVWKRRWIVIGIATIVTLLSVLVALTSLQHKWEASAVLMLRTHPDNFALGTSAPYKPQEYNLATLLDTVKLPSSLDAIMDATGVSVMRRALAAAISVSPGKDSNMFQVKAIWADPETAAAIANVVAERLIERSQSMRRTDAEEVFDYYGKQLEDSRAQRRAIGSEMKQFQAGNDVSDFDTEVKVLIEELSRLEADYNTKVREAEAMRSARLRLEQLIKEEPEMVVLSTIYRSPLKQRLSDYEWQLQEARSRYTEENPKIVKLKRRIAVLEQMIEESKDEGAPQNTYAPNNQLADMRMRLQGVTDELQVREAQVEALEETIEDMRSKLTQLTVAKKEYELIRSRLEGVETLEASLTSRVDEARVMMLRDEASFNLVESARPPEEPMSSKRKLVVAAGVVLGCGSGILLALLLVLRDPLVHSRRDVMDLTGSELVLELERIPPGEATTIDIREPIAPVAMLFRRLVNELDARLEDTDWRCLALTSIEEGAGRSLAATNLAQSLALKEHAVILVDSDLRREAGRRPSEFFNVPLSEAGLWEATHEGGASAQLLTTTGTQGLRLLGPGVIEDVAAGVADCPLLALGTRQMNAVVAELKQLGRVLFDLPPLMAQETVLELTASIGDILLIVRSGQTRRAELREFADLLRERGVIIRAALLTDVPPELLHAKPIFQPSKPKGRLKRAFRNRPEPVEPTLGTHV